MKSRLEIVIEGTRTAAGKTALAQLQQLKAIIKQMREQKEYPTKIKEIEEQGLFQIKSDLLSNSKLEQERINKRLSDLEKAYNKNLKENPINYEAIVARYHGMTDKELHSESVKMIANPRNNNPTIADYLSSELRARGIDTHPILREKLVENDYLRPWLHSDEGQALQKESNFYVSAKPGDFIFEATNQVGKVSTASVNIQGIYDELQ
jgi:hypothetical protein